MNWEALDRYLRGCATADDVATVDAMFAGRPDADVLQRWLTERRYPDGKSPDVAWSSVASAAGIPDNSVSLPPRLELLPRGRPLRHIGAQDSSLRRRRWLSSGAIAAVLLAAGVTALSIDRSNNRTRSSDRAQLQTATKPGQLATVTLPDGSTANLAPATTLVATIDPADGGTDVQVTGEAFFTVTHSTARPFRVHTEGAAVRVLGTTFSVRHYHTDHHARVVVADGRVALRTTRVTRGPVASSSYVLDKGALGVVDDSGNVQITPNATLDDYIDWTHGELVFHQTLVRDVMLELGRAYDVDMRVNDSTLAAQTLSWRLRMAHRSLSDVLEFLSTVLDAHPVRTGRVITLVPGRSAPTRHATPPSSSLTETQYGK